MTEGWTLDELGRRVADALAAGYDGQPSGRVREVPDRRTIRWYTTLGLVDRPSGTRGRTALYGPRHLLQLVAIKRLQSTGRSLAEVQADLAGVGDAELSRVAAVPDEALAAEPPERRDRFWAAPPPPAPAAEPLLQGVRLAEGLTLLVEAARPLDPDDVAALRAAARPLLIALSTRGLPIPTPTGGLLAPPDERSSS